MIYDFNNDNYMIGDKDYVPQIVFPDKQEEANIKKQKELLAEIQAAKAKAEAKRQPSLWW